MTKLVINLRDVIEEVHPSDHLRVWAPTHRAGPNGETVTTRPVKIPLVDGVGEQEVLPGPLVIEIVAYDARQDTRAKQVVIPDDVDEITLAELLEGSFTYTPAVVSRVARDAADAREAADRVGSAEQVGEWASQAEQAKTDAQQVATNLPEMIPPMVSDALADDPTIREAAVVAVQNIGLVEDPPGSGLFVIGA